jgi:hypothetical protein
MEEKNPLTDPMAQREARAGRQERTMKRFFDGLNGKAKRAMRRAAAKVTGRKESTEEMMKRLAKP